MGMPGMVGGGGTAVLEDPTGTRARWMRRAGRVVFVLFLGWLLAIVLGGLGLMPVAGIPLTHVLRPSQGPPPLVKLPDPRKPSASDLRPALSAEVFAARTAKAAQPAGSGAPKTTPAASHVSRGKSATAPGRTKTTAAVAGAHGRSAVAPGQTKTTAAAGSSRGKRATAPGKTKATPALATAHGQSAVAPGQTKTTAAALTSHGKSLAAPGKTRMTPTTTVTTTTTLAPAAAHGQSAVAPGQTKTTATPLPHPKKP